MTNLTERARYEPDKLERSPETPRLGLVVPSLSLGVDMFCVSNAHLPHSLIVSMAVLHVPEGVMRWWLNTLTL